jgi:mercuric ion binding protein
MMNYLSKSGLIAAACLFALPGHAEDRVVTLSMQDMTCAACPGSVKRMLGRIDGVKSIAMRPEQQEAVVTYDADKTNPEALIDVATLAGYPATVKR